MKVKQFLFNLGQAAHEREEAAFTPQEIFLVIIFVRG
jgi:hypothetical protein